MPYGVRRGIKAPGEYGFGDLAALGLSSAGGIFAALATDFSQKGENSALYKINEWVVAAGRNFGAGDMPLWGVALGLVGFGAVSIFYFQPLTRLGAFARGFGLLAAAMTATPTDLVSGIQGASQLLQPLQPAAYIEETSLNPEGEAVGATQTVYREGEVRAFAVQAVRPGARYEVLLTIKFPNGAPRNIQDMVKRDQLRGRLLNEATKETFNLFQSAGGSVETKGDTIVIRAGVPAKAKEATLWVRIEAEGSAIEMQSAKATLGKSLAWTVVMRPSKTPLAIQRLGKSYWF
ncbi:MAG: hypothetical protein ABL957_08330 [Parvularculaceae bacterium]